MASEIPSTALSEPNRLVNWSSATTAIHPATRRPPYAGGAIAACSSNLRHHHADGDQRGAEPIARGLHVAEEIARQRRTMMNGKARKG